jgi:hypothetical protein
MSSKKLQLGRISGRLSQLVDLLENGIPANFAKKADIPQSTFHNYVNGRDPSVEHVIRIRDSYKIDPLWLLTGEGDMFITGDPSRTCSEAPFKIATSDSAAGNPPPLPVPPTAQGFRISDAITMAARVLESGTTYAIALYLNIEHFDRAIQAEARVSALEERVGSLENEILLLKQVLTKCVPRGDPGESVAEEGRPGESINGKVA